MNNFAYLVFFLQEIKIPKYNFEKINFVFFAVIISFPLAAQQCGTSHIPPAAPAKVKQLEKEYVAAMQADEPKLLEDYTLPVVVHIIHNGGAEQLSEAQVQQGIDHLNAAFANTLPYDPDTGVNTQIQFCLAQTDPDGNLTGGITYTQSILTAGGATADQIAELIRWEPDTYINIWVVQDICSVTGGNFCDEIAGYAYGPAWQGSFNDGIYVEAADFGFSPAVSAVLAHEAGHYLGLKHTFDGGCLNNNCLTDGDYVCDTPPDNSTAYIPCDEEINSCTTDTDSGYNFDLNDKIWNYMDYSGTCRTGFTSGQAQRMQYMLENPRSVLLSSSACQPPCLSPLTAAFSAPASVEVGSTVVFTNTSDNADTYEWKINGTVQSDAESWEYFFDNPGIYTVEMTAANNDIYCTQIFAQAVEVTCPAETEIIWEATQPAYGDTLTFTALTNTADFIWRVNGTSYGSEESIIVVFDQIGSYLIELQGNHDFCSDLTSELLILEGEENCEVMPQTFTYGYSTRTNPYVSDPDYIGDFNPRYTVGVEENVYTLGRMRDSTDYHGVLITKYDTLGQIVKAKNFFTPSDASVWVRSRLFAVGDKIAVLSKGNPFSTLNLMIIDANLNLVFAKAIFSTVVSAFGNPYKIIETSTGNYLIFISEDEYEYNRITFIETDAEGNTINVKNIQFPRGTLGNSTGNELFETEDGNFAIVTRRGMTSFNLETGIIWSKEFDLYPTFGDQSDFRIEDATYSNGKTAIIGRNHEIGLFNEVLGLIDENGEPDWMKSYSYTLSSSAINSSVLYPYIFMRDSSIITTQLPRCFDCDGLGGSIYRNVRTKWDFDANVIWSHAESVGSLKIFHEYNDSYYFAGTYPRIGKLNDTRLIRTDQNGYFPGCSAAESTAMTEDIPFAVLDVAAEMTDTLLLPLPAPEILTSDAVVYRHDPCNLLRADAAVDILDSEICSEHIAVTVEICNYGQKTLYPVTSVDFYTAHPDLETSVPFDSDVIGAFLPQNQCDTVVFYTSGIPPTDKLYCIVNQDATAFFPHNQGFDNSTYVNQYECTYDNNLDSLTLPPFAFSSFDLPADTLFCGAIDLTLSAPLGFDTYTWQGDTLGSNYQVTAPGTYTAVVTDNCGLTQTDSLVVTQESNVSLFEVESDLEICTQGTVDLTVPDYPSVLWSDGSSDPDITFTLPGTYIVTAADACGNTKSDTVEVTEIVTDFDLGDDISICAADSVTISLPADFTNITWYAEGGNCTDCPDLLLQPAVSTTLALIAETAAGCPVADTLHIAVATLSQTLSVTPTACADSADGSLTVTDSDAAAFSLDGSDFSPVGYFTDLAPADYTLTAIDSAGCVFQTPFTVTAPPALSVDIGADTLLCAGDAVSLSAPAGQAIYAWSPAAAVTCADCAQTVYRGDFAGTVSLTVTDPTGCTASDSRTFAFSELTPIFSVTDADCHAEASGALTVAADPGAATFGIDGTNFSVGRTFTGLSAGSYTLYVRDTLGCLHESPFDITEPAPLQVLLTADTTVTQGTEVALAAEVSGGTPPYGYAWQPTDFLDCTDCDAVRAVPPYSLAYTANITDAAGCTATSRVQLTVENAYEVYIPTAFSPNGDGINDYFTVFGGANVSEVIGLKIYARKGDLVFAKSNFAPGTEALGWDGTHRSEPLNGGVYVYVAEVLFLDGTRKTFTGEAGLVR